MAATLIPVEAAGSWLKEKSREELKHHLLYSVQRPVIFRNCTDSWTVARRWSPVAVSRILGGRETTFKVCPRRGSDEYRQRFNQQETVFETQCEHVQATFLDFAEWLENAANKHDTLSRDHSVPDKKKLKLDNSSPNQSPHQTHINPLLHYSPSQYWVYADYKYMTQLCGDQPELMEAIDWGVMGFVGRGGADSTLWVGSEECYTPCHYDTYGCNLVAQLWGRKKWTLFSPTDSPYLYPTRLPYEESSVFSEVNIECPNLDRHPDFPSATGYQVDLEAGDVLFVPKHWWHYVQCMESAVSVNTWIDLPGDSYDRVKEGVVRTMMAGWLSGIRADQLDQEQHKQWVNPNEEVLSHAENLELLSLMISEHQAPPPNQKAPTLPNSITPKKWIQVLTSDIVIDAIAKKLTS